MLPMTLSTVEISVLMPALAIMFIWWLLGMLKESLENRQVELRKNEKGSTCSLQDGEQAVCTSGTQPKEDPVF